ncbi:MAG TPA: GNAT family N-acetyltransferase [Xanthomonadaceae bacterium]|jgi:RimJ/RimL family protein N-acetyltransferase
MKRRQTFQRFPLASRWRERIVLREGRELLLRPIHEDDSEPIRNGFALLGADEIRMRYQHPVKSLGEDYLYRLTHPRRGRECVLVLAEPLPPGEALVGAVARLVRDQDTDEAEFAILVSHFLAGQGLGRLLMGKLITCARRRHLHAIFGDVLDDNVPMLRLAESLGFHREASEHPAAVRVRLSLRRAPHASDERSPTEPRAS